MAEKDNDKEKDVESEQPEKEQEATKQKDSEVDEDKETETKQKKTKTGSDGTITFLDKIREKYNKLSKRQKIALTTGLVLAFSLLLLTLLNLIFKFDALIFPSTLRGSVSTESGQFTDEVEVCLNETNCVAIDKEGKYVFTDLVYGNYEIAVNTSNYEDYQAQIKLKRGENTHDIVLLADGVGAIQGTLGVAGGEELILEELVLLIGEQELTFDTEGSFSSETLATGTHMVEIISPNYIDQEIEVDVNDGLNQLEKIELEPAFDLEFKLVEWLVEDAVVNAKITFAEEEYESGKEGKVAITDIPLTDKFSFNIAKNGYNTKKITVSKVEQGLNEINDQKLVERGKITYMSTRSGNTNIYIANYDGSSEVMVSGNAGDNYAPYLDSENSYVYFISDRDNIETTYGTTAEQVYRVGLDGKGLTKISKNDYPTKDGRIGSYSYKSMKRVFDKYATSENLLFTSSIDGTAEKELASTEGYFSSYDIAPNGNYAVYTLVDDTQPKTRLMKILLGDKSTTKLMEAETENSGLTISDISEDSQKLLVRMSKTADNKNDMFIVDANSGSVNRITTTSASEVNAVISPSDKYVSYLSTRDGRTDVYIASIADKTEKKVTNTGKVSGYFWGQDDVIFFNSESILNAVHLDNLSKVEEVTEQVTDDYYGYWYW